jgi:hypothetical protein
VPIGPCRRRWERDLTTAQVAHDFREAQVAHATIRLVPEFSSRFAVGIL